MKQKENKHKNVENKEVSSPEKEGNPIDVDSKAQNDSDKMTDNEEAEVDIETKLAEEVKNWQDKYMRLSAEFDNYRKRTLKEKMDMTENASQGVIKSILPILDDFDRASDAMNKSDDIDSLRSGVELIHKRLIDIMDKQGVKEIIALDTDLNTDFHDAIAKFPVEEEDKKGKIIDVVEKGYMLKDKVVRFAKVVVGE